MFSWPDTCSNPNDHNAARKDDLLKDLAKYETVVVWYMSLHSLDRVVKRLTEHYPPDLPIAIVYYTGYPDREKVLRSRLDAILKVVQEMKEEWPGLFITGRVAGEP